MRMEAGQGVSITTHAGGITPHPYALCTFLLMKSYGQRCIRMPPLRGGQSLVHLCLSAAIKSAAARRIIHPGTGRSIVRVQDAHQSVAKLTLRVRFATGINSRSPADGGLRARYASGEMLASLAPLRRSQHPSQLSFRGLALSFSGLALSFRGLALSFSGLA